MEEENLKYENEINENKIEIEKLKIEKDEVLKNFNNSQLQTNKIINLSQENLEQKNKIQTLENNISKLNEKYENKIKEKDEQIEQLKKLIIDLNNENSQIINNIKGDSNIFDNDYDTNDDLDFLSKLSTLKKKFLLLEIEINKKNKEINELKINNQQLIDENKKLNLNSKPIDSEREGIELTINNLKELIKEKEDEIIKLKNEKKLNELDNNLLDISSNSKISQGLTESEKIEKYKKKIEEYKERLKSAELQLQLLRNEIKEIRKENNSIKSFDGKINSFDDFLKSFNTAFQNYKPKKKQAEERKEKINQKIKEEEETRNEIRIKAAEYISEFNQKRQEDIAKKRKMLEEKEHKIKEENKGDTWSNVKNNIDMKDSEYKGSKDVQRMREAMLNNPNSQPMQNIFG